MQKAGIAALASPALIPALGPIICIGLMGVAIVKLLEDDDRGSGQSGKDEGAVAGQKTEIIDGAGAFHSVGTRVVDDGNLPTNTATDLNKQELIRQAMSELGRRSGAARAKKIKS